MTAQDDSKTHSFRPSFAGYFVVNLDPEILTLFREIECMERLKFEIPPVAVEMKLRSDSIKRNYQLLEQLVREHERIMESVNPEFERLLTPRFYKIYRCFEPVLVLYNWRSLNIEHFVKVSNCSASKPGHESLHMYMSLNATILRRDRFKRSLEEH